MPDTPELNSANASTVITRSTIFKFANCITILPIALVSGNNVGLIFIITSDSIDISRII